MRTVIHLLLTYLLPNLILEVDVFNRVCVVQTRLNKSNRGAAAVSSVTVICRAATHIIIIIIINRFV